MRKERNQRPPRKMKPVFLVFCEGETEEVYINFLRQKYRLPIKVISHTIGQSISPKIIQRYIEAEKISKGDTITTFLMYDLDSVDMAEKLLACKKSILLWSNPSIELWFLLHLAAQNGEIKTDACIALLRKTGSDWGPYVKGSLSDKQKQALWENRLIACDRAKQLPEGENPSSAVFRLIEKMEEVKT